MNIYRYRIVITRTRNDTGNYNFQLKTIKSARDTRYINTHYEYRLLLVKSGDTLPGRFLARGAAAANVWPRAKKWREYTARSEAVLLVMVACVRGVPAVVGACDETAAEVAEGRLAGARRGGRRRARRVEAMPEAAG